MTFLKQYWAVLLVIGLVALGFWFAGRASADAPGAAPGDDGPTGTGEAARRAFEARQRARAAGGG